MNSSNKNKLSVVIFISICILLANYNSKGSKGFVSNLVNINFSDYALSSDLELLTSFFEQIIVKFPSRKTLFYCIVFFFLILSYSQYFLIFLDISKEKMLSLNPFKSLIDVTYSNSVCLNKGGLYSTTFRQPNPNYKTTLRNYLHTLPFSSSSSTTDAALSYRSYIHTNQILAHPQSSQQQKRIANGVNTLLTNVKWINNIRMYNTKVNQEKAIQNIADYIINKKCKNIIVMTGAGISTNSNIPDFRTPGKGLYSKLDKFNLPTAQSIFDIVYYRHDPVPFCHIAKDYYTKNYRPTLTHYFITLLAKHNLLLRNFTQNIDGLEEKAGLDEKYIIQSHGTFKTAHCVGNELGRGCGKAYTQEWFKDKMMKMKKPICPVCHGVVKPDIVFFGEDLPIPFWFGLQQDLPKCDLLIVLGTSLQVHPFASLPDQVPQNIPRLLINKNPVGPFKEFDLLSKKTQHKDYVYLGDCDKGCLELAKALNMDKELMELYEKNK